MQLLYHGQCLNGILYINVIILYLVLLYLYSLLNIASLSMQVIFCSFHLFNEYSTVLCEAHGRCVHIEVLARRGVST